MTGSNYNKTVRKQSGQVLLITVMILATVITIVLSLSFKSTTETKITKLEEENQKALAAAEAGIEQSLRSGNPSGTQTFTSLGLSLPGINADSSTASFEVTEKPTFVTPLLQKDEQYTFYFGYNPVDHSFTPGWGGNLTLYFGTENYTCANPTNVPVLELVTITSINTFTQRRLVDPCHQISPNTDLAATYFAGGTKMTGDNTTFYYRLSNPWTDFSTTKVAIVRVLYKTTKVGFFGSSGTVNLPKQGTTITSEAKSVTGVTKRVQLFQSYPQIPAEFFVTSF